MDETTVEQPSLDKAERTSFMRLIQWLFNEGQSPILPLSQTLGTSGNVTFLGVTTRRVLLASSR